MAETCGTVQSSTDRDSAGLKNRSAVKSLSHSLEGEEVQADIGKAASKDDVYELIRLAQMYADTPQIAEVDEALRQVATRLGHKRKKSELAYLLLLPDDPGLAVAAECVANELVAMGPEVAEAVLYVVRPSSQEATKVLAISVLEAVGSLDAAAGLRDSLPGAQREALWEHVPRPEVVAKLAREARANGRRFFQVAVPVSVTEREGAAGYLTTSVSRRDVSPGASSVLEAVEAEGWHLEHAGYVFEERGSISARRVVSLTAGEKEAVMGSIVGIYLFRAVQTTSATADQAAS